MPLSFNAGVRDSLSNLAASLGAGKDKAAHDAFFVFDLDRAQIEAMYRGDWLARKVVDIVPYDTVRAWREWSGHRADVARIEASERRLGLRKTIQRAMVLGRLYGGGAILIGDGEMDPAALARPLDPRLPRDGLAFLHAVSRWQLGVSEVELNPLSPWCGEPKLYTLSSPGRPALELHPSRVVRFLGNPLPDPSVAGAPWSDSVLLALYDAVHAAALSLAGATSFMHEAKVDVVTVPNLSEHLSSAETTAQLSARFAYAAAMKSINNLLLLGDGESWARQRIDFGGLPEMVRCFLQVAAGAADIPVTRLLGQSPAGLSATGDSDTRNYYDMIAARQELDLRPQLERLDRLICRSEGIDPGALTFAFRPLWQLDEPARAALALSRAQATQVYAGLKPWPDAVMAKLVEAQLVADGTYPNAAAVFAEAGEAVKDAREVGAVPRASGGSWPGEGEPRDWHGRWTTGAEGAHVAPVGSAAGAASPVQGRQLAGPLPVGSTPSLTPSAATGREPHAPDGTPVDLASSRGRGRALARAMAALAAAARSVRRWLPKKPEEPEPPLPNVDPGLPEPSGPLADEPEKTPSKPLTPHSSLPDTERDDIELPAGVTPEEAKELHLKGSPVGISLEVRGNNTTELGDSYSDQVNLYRGAQKAPPALKRGGSEPDGILPPRDADERLCVEAKFIGKWSESLYNPDLRRVFSHGRVQGTIDQALKYDKHCTEGVEWYTNSLDFVRAYAPRFEEAGVKNFTFTIIPAIRVKP